MTTRVTSSVSRTVSPMEGLEFYSTAAQIIPVILLALVLEARLLGLSPDERLAESLWIVAFVGAMVVGEMSALAVLREGEPASGLEDAVIILAIFYGVVLIAALPVLPRLRALRDAPPRWLAMAIEGLAVAGFAALAVLASFDVVSARTLSLVVAAAVLVVLVAARGWSVFSRRPHES
jgi:hypothetical protein